jgi:uncharacterized OB-fold protein
MFPYLPHEDSVSAPYWAGTRERKLMLQFCTNCSQYQWYPRFMCIICGKEDLQWRESSGKGTIDSWTLVARAVSEGFVPPYVIARVLLSEKVIILTRIVGIDSPTCDQNVELSWQELSDGRAIPVFTQTRSRS